MIATAFLAFFTLLLAFATGLLVWVEMKKPEAAPAVLTMPPPPELSRDRVR